LPSILAPIAASQVLISNNSFGEKKMANAIVTIKIMPEAPDTDLAAIEKVALREIEAYAGKGDTKTEIEPIAFGLKALKITFIMDENLGSPEPLEKTLASLEGVNSAETIDVRRAVG
jgi:elongation factor 1-beta